MKVYLPAAARQRRRVDRVGRLYDAPSWHAACRSWRHRPTRPTRRLA